MDQVTKIHIKRLGGDEIIHSIDIHLPCSQRKLDRIVDGLYHRMDLEHFYLDDDEAQKHVGMKSTMAKGK